jgi:hypothetical protein
MKKTKIKKIKKKRKERKKEEEPGGRSTHRGGFGQTVKEKKK